MRWPEINLAPIKYSKVLKEDGGPIERIAVREISQFGSPAFEAYAYLMPALRSPDNDDKKVYGSSDGTGTSPNRAHAVYMAISEALERWAWYKSLTSTPSAYGLSADSSTNGFAAFPGLGKWPARRRALNEAVERWSVCAWWESKLGHREISGDGLPPGVSAILLDGTYPQIHTVILWLKNGALVTYGFAASDSEEKAIKKALIELDRNQKVLSSFVGDVKSLTSRNERRLAHFSGAGFQQFARRVSEVSPSKAAIAALAFDGPVSGPWSCYAHVWRCAFDQTDFNDSGADDYFMF